MPDPKPPASAELLSGNWSGGTCKISGNTLNYKSSDNQASVKLDVVLHNPKMVLCSGLFSVILEPKNAVIIIGAESVLAGREVLGSLGDQYVFANSYSVNINLPASENILRQRIVDHELWLDTGAGKRWVLDMSDPFTPWQPFKTNPGI